ncbi:MAG TPA: molybdenum cofactor biosynthesis protein MoaE [Planctomycetota bacterium]|nr:molybdenum cofactor biosynthesis protein MoaE [Planctomycetota bacterium]
MDFLTRTPLDCAAIEASVYSPESGAVVTFVGRTRNEHLGRPVRHLEYEAHEALARKIVGELAAEAKQKFGLVQVAIQHRLGRLEIGDASVVIAVSSGHRGAAFDGCRWLIDSLKTRVPVFKKEYYADGSAPEWVGPDGKPVQL